MTLPFSPVRSHDSDTRAFARTTPPPSRSRSRSHDSASPLPHLSSSSISSISFISAASCFFIDFFYIDLFSILHRSPLSISVLFLNRVLFSVIVMLQCYGFNMGYWIFQNISFNNQLEVTIELSDGSNEIQFAKHILEHAPNFKQMKVFHSPQQSTAIRKIKKHMIASSAKVVFLEDQKRGT